MKHFFSLLLTFAAASAFGQTCHLTVESENGRVVGKNVYDASGTKVTGTGLPDVLAENKVCALTIKPIVSGYKCNEVTVTSTLADGTVQNYSGTLPSTGLFTIPADKMVGEVHLCADFHPTDKAELQMVFHDEFDAKNIDSKKWRTSDRYAAAWNRFISSDKRVAYQQDGYLVCRCIANPGDIKDDAQMISGAKDSRDRFSFNHGYVEARIKTTPHSGNFPAFWLMPQDRSDGWPTCGEIDIWETIDTQNTAYHTVHSHWTYDLKNGGNSGSETCTQEGQWHTYGLLKEADRLTWYVDGVQKFTYTKSEDANALSQGQWPFDKAFYIILNQSVGNGGWAQNPDLSFTYETLFDWVRVYQSPDEAKADGNKVDGIAPIQLDSPATSAIFDLQGRSLQEPRKGQLFVQGGKVHLAM